MRTPLWAIIFKPWENEPVYHFIGPGSPTRTMCGRRVGSLTPWLPYKHVTKFGRPCKDCSPTPGG